jgi:hypothetical protein
MLVPETLQDGVETHLFLLDLWLEVADCWGRVFAEGAASTFAAFVLEDSVSPLLDVTLSRGY